MNFLQLFSVPAPIVIAFIPTMLAILSLQLVTIGLFRIFVPAMLWVQFGFMSYLFWPVLIGEQTRMQLSNDFGADRLSAMFILLATGVVAACMTQAVNYFNAEREHLNPFQIAVFYASSSAFLVAMTLVYLCDNLGLLWVCIEATTLSSAPLVYFERTGDAIEATWKYLIICSVGIAFALLGTIMIFASSQQVASGAPTLNLIILIARAPQLNITLLNLGFIFCILGYGTKAGIFPLHNWLPDAHSEAPAPGSAMLSGALLNCALWGIWRTSHIVIASNKEPHAMLIVSIMGAITTLAGALFLIRQHSFKRMWAYSSIENVGIMLTAIGLGSGLLFVLQAINHSIAKVALFLLSGNIVQATGTKKLSALRGLLEAQPIWAVLLMLAALAVTGAPPFGAFFSELQILTREANPHHWPIALALLLGITISFIAVVVHVGRLVCGNARPAFKAYQPIAASIVPAILVLCSLALGLFLPPDVWNITK